MGSKSCKICQQKPLRKTICHETGTPREQVRKLRCPDCKVKK